MAKKDYYETLGVDKSSTEAEIKSAFRKMAKQYHPDNKETGDEAKFKEIGEAYAVLSDSSKKQQYDQFGHQAFEYGFGNAGGGFGNFQGFEDIDLSSIFDDLFGGSFGSFGFGGGSRGRRGRSNQPTKGEDTLIHMVLTFEEAVYGCEKEITLNLDEECDKCNGKGGFDEKTCPTCDGHGVVIQQQRSMLGVFQTQTTCPDCHGSGKTFKDVCDKCNGRGSNNERKTIIVKVPEGVDDGNQIRMSEKGSAGTHGGPNGDIYIEFKVKKHSLYERDENDIYLELPLTITEAVLGCKKEIPSLWGNVVVTIDEGTQTGDKLRIKGKGVTDPNRGKKGDMYIITKVIIPEKLDRKQKNLFKDLDKTTLDNSSEFKEYKKYLD